MPAPSFYLFIPRDERLQERYEAFPKITEIFPVNSVGIVTARDHLTVHWSPEEVWNTVRRFAHLDPELARQAYDLGKDARDWKVALAQKDLLDSGPKHENIVPILYRPFDIRYTYYTGHSRGFHCMPRFDVMRHMLRENLGLITVRKVPPTGLCNYFFVSEKIISNGAIRSDNQSIDYLFPLYLYDGRKSVKKRSALARTFMLFEPESGYGRIPNLAPAILEMLAKRYGVAPSPEDIFHYIYAVLHAETYRSRYADFLRMDFPRIPFAENRDVFGKLGALGKELVDLHLLRSAELDTPAARFQGEAGPVEKIRYIESENRIYLGKNQYVEGAPPEVWTYRIGGYQVCEKWLKDRKGRTLTPAEIKHYCRLVTALQKTIDVQRGIDQLYPEIDPSMP
jgi:predicted helicase